MSNWRSIKSAARAVVHGTFSVPAVYLTHVSGTPVPCNIRDHSKVVTNESDSVFSGGADHLAIDPSVIFAESEVPRPLAKALVIISDTEIYRVGTAEPFRGGFCKATVTELSPAERTALLGQLDTSGPEWSGIAL